LGVLWIEFSFTAKGCDRVVHAVHLGERDAEEQICTRHIRAGRDVFRTYPLLRVAGTSPGSAMPGSIDPVGSFGLAWTAASKHFGRDEALPDFNQTPPSYSSAESNGLSGTPNQ
jgi:hypothetical protein